MIKVNVILHNINWKKYFKNPENYIEKQIKLINRRNNLYKKKRLIFSLALSNSKEIKKLNKKFRNKNKSTDVLSFPFYKPKLLIKKINKEKEIYLGDIILNLAKIKFKNNIHKFRKQFDQLWIHGFVHLLGYKHKLNKEFNKMNKIEKKYLEFINK